MTTPYTQQEWCDILKPALQDLPNVPLSYDPPRLGTIEFAQCIDHTLLKLDATEEQIDQLCEEARINKFKVCTFDQVHLQFPALCQLEDHGDLNKMTLYLTTYPMSRYILPRFTQLTYLFNGHGF